MRPARDRLYIATIADLDGWVFEHVLTAASASAAEREIRDLAQPHGMRLIEVRAAPPENGRALRVPLRTRALRALGAQLTRAQMLLDGAIVPSLRALRRDAQSPRS